MLKNGQSRRKTACHLKNERSSRSHTILVLTLSVTENKDTDHMKKRVSHLNLVDLAGSERVAQTNARGALLADAQSINKSLQQLRFVIMNIVKVANGQLKSNFQVGFRDSVLTRLLSNSLGGNSKTTLIVTASRLEEDFEQSISTFRFATDAKQIRNKAKITFELTTSEMIAKIKRLEDQIKGKASIQVDNSRLLELESELEKQRAEFETMIMDLNRKNDSVVE